jgi:hypothetical protein
MNTAVFTFVKPSPNSVIASVRIAQFIAKTLDIPLFWDADIRDERLDLLFLVNGAFSFCSARDDLAVAIRRAKRIIWVQNDYAIYAPIADGAAESPFRKAFRIRREKGLPHLDHWTTVKVKADLTKSSRYINWNMLTALRTPLYCTTDQSATDLFYYGAFRNSRLPSFNRYLKRRKMPITISSSNKKFAERYPHATIQSSIDRKGFYHELNSHGLGLYIEDPRSHREFHSPANRFYEMLSAGLPMIFEPESIGMLKAAGYDVSPYVARNQKDARLFLERRREVQRHQRTDWWTDFRADLTDDLLRAVRRYMRVHFPSS